MRRSLLLAALAVALSVVVAPATPAAAHPLGNFTVNTYSGLRVGEGGITVDFLVDMAEIPTLQHRADVDSAGEASYARRSCAAFADRLDLRLDDTVLVLRVDSSAITFAPGQAGLPTLRLACTVSAPTGSWDGDEHRVSFASSNFTDRAGWREITAVGDGTTLVDSDVPAVSVSERLARYPENLLASPLDQRTARLVVRPGGPSAGSAAVPARVSPLPRGVDGATRAFTSFVSRQDLTLGFAVLALAGSVLLGGIHAFAPGHGKTVMAAYLVGQKGSFRQAMAVALTVTATHTAGVLALGIAISTSAVVAPERVYPWLGAASGVLLALLGLGFLRRIVRTRRIHGEAHHDHHDLGHSHAHGGHTHSHGPVVAADPLVTRRGLLAMGFVGGLLPSPSAVVVLLGAVALGRTWFGVLLVVAYGLGMAAALAATGLVLLKARGALDRRVSRLRGNRLLAASTRLLPPATAVFIVTVGVYLTARAAAQI
ncbi:MAG: nickel/cobalt transporter (NicO) family protein [Actinomycetota bacterium]|nr:nickel/cobalt transporter (NicO) family protein [Actinomycetota bacterium]